jgi:FKBP-type peptidyl-prolyl cis-trans isomerase FkpA
MIERSSRRTLGLAVAVSLALVACGDDVLGPNPSDVAFDDSLEIVLADMTETESGLLFQDAVEGTGEEPAALGDAVTLTYTGWLANGEEFDSGSFLATLGETNLIEGFTEGLVGMRVGGTRTIVIPAHLGYGSAGQGTIPANAVLVFEIMVTALTQA